jgi:mono/diheme cytochrome c family protein
MNITNKIKSIIWFSVPTLLLFGCVAGGDNPGIEYAPNMYISQAYEPYKQEKKFDYNPNGMTMRLPVFGTIAKGQTEYVYPNPNTGEGYEAAANFTSWVSPTESNVGNGELKYNTYCTPCHGSKGKNDGSIFKSGKMPGPSWSGFQDEYIQNLPVGKIYHTITYGKGLMGSHASVLTPKERWQVIYYVKSLSLGDAFKYADDEQTSEEMVISQELDAEEENDNEDSQN